MSQSQIYNQTADRLDHYGLFSSKTIETVATLAQKQTGYVTYHEFFKDVGISEVFLYRTKQGDGVPVVDIPSKHKQTHGVLVIHLPMANSLDPTQLYQVATIAASLPGFRVIAFGNPSGKPYAFREQNLTFKKRLAIAFRKNLQPLVKAELEYLKAQNLKNVYHIGYSYGSLKAMIATIFSRPDSIKGLVLIEPVAHPRYPQQLLGDFASAFKPMGDYVNRTKIQTYFDARQDAVKIVQYSKGLLRPINVAIGYMLSRIDFIEMFEDVLEKHPKLLSVVAWGSKSEVGNDAHMKVSFHRLSLENKRVKSMRLEGDTHSFANDIHVYAAIVVESVMQKYS